MSFLTQQPEKMVFFKDGGHGWLRVTRSDLVQHRLEDKISTYSYQSIGGDFVYLEEDLDLATFADVAMRDAPHDWFDAVLYVYDEAEILRNSQSLERYQPA